MKRYKLIEILNDKLSDTDIIINDNSDKTIYFKNKKTERTIDIKCYSYHEKENLEIDSCIWYFFIYEGQGDYSEYMIPEKDSETYIDVLLDNYFCFLDKKRQLDYSLDKLRKLRGKEVKKEIRDYKLNKLFKLLN